MPSKDEIAANQEILVRLLRTNLDLAAVLAQAAALQAVVDPGAAPRSIELAQLALKSNRAMAGQIRDLAVGLEILARADEIDELILRLVTQTVTH